MRNLSSEKSMRESTQASQERMEQWNEWKFGLYPYMGPWSQSHRGAIWEIMQVMTPEERKEAFEFYKSYNPIRYNPSEWAELAKKAGMKYVVFIAKHHDGFCNYDTKTTYFRITNLECSYSKSPNPDLVDECLKPEFSGN